MDELQQLEAWAAPQLARLAPTERRAVARTIGRELRRRQAQRISGQLNPDGSAFAPRKRARSGQIRRRADRMFTGLTTAKHFKVQVNDHGVAVGFFGRVARIARVHHEGLTDRVTPGGPTVRYERRQLLGFTDEERRLIRDLLIEHLTATPGRTL